jgi:sugar-specific transcriptional regulator TrmB
VVATDERLEEAVQGLQQLGLQEYEARCFVGLSRLPSGTAKKLSEITEVPRTRVYDAIRVLESKGLVEIHHSSPQQFRAVSLEEAMETLRDQYESRVSRVQRALEDLDAAEEAEASPIQEVWSISGTVAVEHRTTEIVGEAEQEVLLIIGDESMLTGGLVAALTDIDENTALVVGAVSERLREDVRDAVDPTATFTDRLDWLRTDGSRSDIGHVLLVDRSKLLVSSLPPDAEEMHAVYSSGTGNGLVVLTRRLVSEELVPPLDRGEH